MSIHAWVVSNMAGESVGQPFAFTDLVLGLFVIHTRMSVHHDEALKGLAICLVETVQLKGQPKRPKIGFPDAIFSFEEQLLPGSFENRTPGSLSWQCPWATRPDSEHMTRLQVNDEETLLSGMK